MTEVAATRACPKGHASTEADYCSECGARIEGAAADEENTVHGAPQSFTGEVCPDCATLREQPEIAFCEVCGYNFATGARGEIPPTADATSPTTAAPAPPDLPTAATSGPADSASRTTRADDAETVARWSVLVATDPALQSSESPAAPASFTAFTVSLEQPVSLIGRLDESKGIFPQIALTFDEAVSRRHALLQRSAGGLLLRDIGSSNGTRLNGVEIAALTDHPLQEGDEITLGHWTRLRLQRS